MHVCVCASVCVHEVSKIIDNIQYLDTVSMVRSDGLTSNSMPESISTPLRGSFSIETLVSYSAYLVWLDHMYTRTSALVRVE